MSADLATTRSRRSLFGLATKIGAVGVVATVAPLATTASPAGAATGAAAGAELGYAQTTSVVTTTTSTVVPNLVIAVPTGDGPVAVEYGAYVTSSASAGLVKLYLLQDGRPVHEVGCTVAGSHGVSYLRGLFRVPASSGATPAFKVMLCNWTAGARVQALAVPTSPAFVQARRL